jgi:hypothetical protein
MITPELQAAFIADRRDIFLPIHGGWGRMGMTHIRLAMADEGTLTGALHTAWKLRVEKNRKGGKKTTPSSSRKPAATSKPAKPR